MMRLPHNWGGLMDPKPPTIILCKTIPQEAPCKGPWPGPQPRGEKFPEGHVTPYLKTHPSTICCPACAKVRKKLVAQRYHERQKRLAAKGKSA